MSRIIRAFALFVPVVVTVPAIVNAQGTDVVLVTSGDRFTGTVTGLERGELSLDTDAAGTIGITWDKVVTLDSAQRLDVELSSGTRYSGPISSPAANQLVVGTASGPTQPIDLKAVVRISRVGSGFQARTSGSIDFGASFMKANDAGAYTLDAAITHLTGSYETSATVSSWLQQRDDAETLTRNDLELDVRRLLPQRWFAVAMFGLQEDDELELEWRTVAGGGVGRKVVQSNRMLLRMKGGLDYASESYRSTPEIDHSAEVFAGADWDYFSPSWSTETVVVATAFFGLERTRSRLELDAQLRRDTFWNLYWSVNVFESFDSDPPGDRERSDLGVSFTLGRSF